MAEEISSMKISIEAKVDQALTGIKNVQNTLESMEKSTKKTAQATANSFDAMQKSTLELTAVAIKLDSTISAVQNQALRLENAHERLANAQDRVRDSQKNLTRSTEDYNRAIQKYGKESDEARQASQRLEDVQQEAIRAQRGLEISQNNLNRVQGQNIGVALNVASSTAVLAGQLVKLKDSTIATTIATRGLNAALAANPVTVALAVAGLVAGAITMKKFGESAQEAGNIGTSAFSQMSPELLKVSNTLSSLNTEFGSLKTQAEDFLGLVTEKKPLTGGEFGIAEQIASLKEERVKLQESLRSMDQGEEKNQARLRISIIADEIKSQEANLNAAIQRRIDSYALETVAFQKEKTEKELADKDLTLKSLDNVALREEAWQRELEKIDETTAAIKRRIASEEKLKELILIGEETVRRVEQQQIEKARQAVTYTDPLGEYLAKNPTKNKGRKNDFLMRSDGTVLEFSPQDNILGFKGSMPSNGGATIINITVQGSVTTERELAESISRHMNQTAFARTNFI